SGVVNTPGADLLWSDLLARALWELAGVAAIRHVTPISDQPPDVATAGGGRPGRVRARLARMMRPWAARTAGRMPEPGAGGLPPLTRAWWSANWSPTRSGTPGPGSRAAW